jgi:hypothetical protein
MKQIFNFWLKPGQTIDSMEKEETGKAEVQINTILFFISLYGILQIPKIILYSVTKNDSLTEYLYRIVAVLFLFLFIKYVSVSCLWVFSKLFQGVANRKQIRLVQTYSLSPLLVLLPFASIQFIRVQLFPDSPIEGTFSVFFQLVFSIFTFSYLVLGLCKVNKFSYGYGILTIFMAGSVFELLKLIMHR